MGTPTRTLTFDTEVDIIHPDGSIQKAAYIFVNDCLPEDNLVSLCMQINRNFNLLDDRHRNEYKGRIIYTEHYCYFARHNGDVYLARSVLRDENRQREHSVSSKAGRKREKQMTIEFDE